MKKVTKIAQPTQGEKLINQMRVKQCSFCAEKTCLHRMREYVLSHNPEVKQELKKALSVMGALFYSVIQARCLPRDVYPYIPSYTPNCWF